MNDWPRSIQPILQSANYFGILRWEVEERCNQIDFLDLTIWINKENRIMTKTFRKPQNIYQYIPKQSAHPPGVGRAIIFGCMRRYRLQNFRIAYGKTTLSRSTCSTLTWRQEDGHTTSLQSGSWNQQINWNMILHVFHYKEYTNIKAIHDDVSLWGSTM